MTLFPHIVRCFIRHSPPLQQLHFNKTISTVICNMELFDAFFTFNKKFEPDELAHKQAHWRNKIHKHYGERQRHYHTINHIQDMGSLWNQYHHRLQEPALVALAILFHDVIYDPQAGDNEEKSATVFQKFSQDFNMEGPDFDKVYTWILETKKHTTTAHQSDVPGESDLHYFLDFDMAVLGRETHGYIDYARQIRKEYNNIPEQKYTTGRATVLREFLKTPFIFATKEFRDIYETQARENINSEIKYLESDKS